MFLKSSWNNFSILLTWQTLQMTTWCFGGEGISMAWRKLCPGALNLWSSGWKVRDSRKWAPANAPKIWTRNYDSFISYKNLYSKETGFYFSHLCSAFFNITNVLRTQRSSLSHYIPTLVFILPNHDLFWIANVL